MPRKISRAVTGYDILLRLDYVESRRRTLGDIKMPSGCVTAEAYLLHPVAVLGTYRRGWTQVRTYGQWYNVDKYILMNIPETYVRACESVPI